MRRSIQSLLLILVVLVYAGTASAVSITVVDTRPDPSPWVIPSDQVTIDVLFDTEGVTIIGYQFHVAYNPASLSFVSAVQTPPPGFNYYRTNPDPPYGLIAEGVNWGVGAAVNQVVLSAVFHIIVGPISWPMPLTPTLVDYGVYDNILLLDYSSFPEDEIVLSGVTFHVPEPTTTVLMVLGFFGILYAGRRRRRAA